MPSSLQGRDMFNCDGRISGACSRQAIRFHTRHCQTFTLLFVSDTGKTFHSWHFVWKSYFFRPNQNPSKLGSLKVSGVVAEMFANVNSLHIDNSARMVLGCFVDFHASVRTAISIYFERKLTDFYKITEILRTLWLVNRVAKPMFYCTGKPWFPIYGSF